MDATTTETGPANTNAALANLVVVLGDNKYYLGRRLSEWAVGAPGLESAVACAAIAQEELGHTRALYSWLEDVPGAPAPLERGDERERTYCVGFLLDSFPSWQCAVAALYLVDAAMTTVLEALEGTADEALRRRATRILGDEPIHRKYAQGRVREMGRGREGQVLARWIEELLPEILCWFGPPGEEGVETLRREGLLRLGNEELRQDFLARIMPPLQEAALATSVEWDTTNERWEYPKLPWSTWNSLERRLTTSPASR